MHVDLSYGRIHRENADMTYDIQAHHLLMNFEEPLKDYVRAVQSIKVSLDWSLKLCIPFKLNLIYLPNRAEPHCFIQKMKLKF